MKRKPIKFPITTPALTLNSDDGITFYHLGNKSMKKYLCKSTKGRRRSLWHLCS